ncbi:Ppx/GppA phosphatase family protein [Dokdonia sp. Hel_I_53]|uniref:Ppx/GppA phosphatase family protein n=1 Tax=Dokdonia sp. Hel_I_53 TaxID=1566287 RepID=UPI00119B8739|nr:rod shape-determining protein [Dokdonia sp. Hel_I_53]TVZ51154.1 exopolyphosphatase/guanosine-5'-triphosphate,3'-diphosphate pyrophosphatase [Dokdonia sp. Hel_I_53]
MLSITKYAAIDIGSNAIRLLIANVIEQPGYPTLFRKNALVRVPIRLGEDVFINGEISEVNQGRMIDAMKAFRLLMNAHQVVKYRACATSAMRDASNGFAFAKAVKKETSIAIDIIDGVEEAAIIATTDLKTFIKEDRTYLYVDVGGGSTELTIYHMGKIVASKSFKIGTVRLLNDLVASEDWDLFKKWIVEHTLVYPHIDLIGSGGNINKVFKLSSKKPGKTLSFLYLTQLYKELNEMSYEERIVKLSLNPDRADVIIPAIRIYLQAMKTSKGKQIIVPKIGLSDGIIRRLYQVTS